MDNKEIDKLKKSIKELKLDSYYNDLRNNCLKLWKKKKEEGLDGFYDGINFIDIYNPDIYSIVIYLIHHDNKLYIGNEQIPLSKDMDNKQRTVNMIEYWFRGNNSNYTVLYEFTGIHNKSINCKGYGCNQDILRIIKNKIIEKIITNLNIYDIGELKEKEVENQYGRLISIYKSSVRRLLKKTTVEDFSNTILVVLKDIERNKNKWCKILYEKNRYWFISEYEQDKKEVKEFLSLYGYNNECYKDELYKAVLIIFKEYFLWQLCEDLTGNYWKTVFSKKDYIKSPKCTYHELYDWKKLFDNHKPISIILSICYKNVYEDKIIKDYSYYKKFRNKLYKNIDLENNDR